MEKIPCICVMRDLMKTLSELENHLEESYGVTLNEAMVLCSIGNETVTASSITSCTGLTPSHTSKVIRSAEDKGLIERELGKLDKRQMYFKLTSAGKSCLENIKEHGIDIPEWIAALFRN